MFKTPSETAFVPKVTAPYNYFYDGFSASPFVRVDRHNESAWLVQLQALKYPASIEKAHGGGFRNWGPLNQNRVLISYGSFNLQPIKDFQRLFQSMLSFMHARMLIEQVKNLWFMYLEHSWLTVFWKRLLLRCSV